MLKKSGKSADPHLLTLPGFLRQRLLIAFLERMLWHSFFIIRNSFPGQIKYNPIESSPKADHAYYSLIDALKLASEHCLFYS